METVSFSTGAALWAIISAMANGLTYTRTIPTVEAMKHLASTLAPYLHEGDTIVLAGDLGAGKTQFVQGVAAALGIEGQLVSPTFNIVLEYTDGRLPLYHFDLYRLDDDSELEDIGFYEITDGDGVSFIEWGDKFKNQLPYDFLYISITVERDGRRKFVAHSVGERSRQMLYVWANDSKSRLSKCGEVRL